MLWNFSHIKAKLCVQKGILFSSQCEQKSLLTVNPKSSCRYWLLSRFLFQHFFTFKFILVDFCMRKKIQNYSHVCQFNFREKNITRKKWRRKDFSRIIFPLKISISLGTLCVDEDTIEIVRPATPCCALFVNPKWRTF